jgi:adenylate kinase family enzyme
MENYYTKYIKYKNKYLQLKQTGGGNMIIHISGSQGSGKTTLGKILFDKYKDIIIVKDLDDLRDDFKKQKEITNYQIFIDEFIKKNIKPIIFTGLSAEKCLGEMNNDDNTFYLIKTDYKFFINIDENEVLKQRFFRQIDKLSERREIFFENWKINNEQTQKKLVRFINLSQWKENNKACKEIHEKHGYIFLDQSNILKEIDKLIVN